MDPWSQGLRRKSDEYGRASASSSSSADVAWTLGHAKDIDFNLGKLKRKRCEAFLDGQLVDTDVDDELLSDVHACKSQQTRGKQ